MTWLREPDDEPIPGYKLVEPLGTGGFGEVWKCVAPGGLHKAIKFVFGNLNSLDGDSQKAEQEYKALERIKLVRHTFVLSMDRIEVVGGELLIVMELADKSLHDCFNEYVAAGQPGIPRSTLLRYMSDAAEGLDHLNEKNNLQHLDVKPKNLFLISDHVKVADFGLVKHLERQSSAGLMGGVTPVYAAPETFANKISKQSDQYSLAVLYCEMLTGVRPFNGKNIRQLALQHMTEPPDLSMLPPADQKAVAKALAKNPEERWPNCVSFVAALSGKTTKGDSSVTFPTPRSRTVSDINITTPPPGHTPPARPGLKHDPSITATVSKLEVGVLRPSILIGVGSFGRRAIHQIRGRLLDRVGDLQQVPSFRFLYIDVDPQAADKVNAMTTEAAIEPEQLLQLPLQPATAYRRKQIDQILEWLPREKLYSIPRSLNVEGSRALGRLAFSDHYLKVTTRLKNEITIATHPEAMKQSADQTGLAIRDKRPSVYIFASATGGSGGMLLDLGHAVRRVMEKYNITDAPVTAFVYTGCPDDTTAPPDEQANVYATLTELNHYADKDVTFTARYGGIDGPRVEANGLPFSATYIVPIARRTTESFRDCLSHLSSYISQELTTPLGQGLEDYRKRHAGMNRTPFRGFGTFGVWFPRGLLLRSAARQLCLRLLKSWTEIPEQLPPAAESLVSTVYNDPRLTPEAVQQFIAAESAQGADGAPLDALGKWLKSVTEQADQAARRGEGANWATAVWDQAKDAVGLEPTTEADSPYRRGRFSRAIDPGLHAAITAWDNELVELLRPLEDQPGSRLAAVDSALHALASGFESAARLLEEQLPSLLQSRQESKAGVQSALESCSGGSGSFTFFGNRQGRSLRTLADRIKRFIDVRCSEDLAVAGMLFYRRMAERMHERLHDTALVREHLAKLVGVLETSMQAATAKPRKTSNNPSDAADEAVNTTLQMSNTVRVVLPNNDDHLDRAAGDMLTQLQPGDYQRLQDVVQRLVLDPRGGLETICKTTPDLRRGLAVPIVEQMTAFLTNLLPTQDVAQIEMASPEAKSGELGKRIATYLKHAQPQVGGPPDDERTYVLVPATAAGLQYAREVKGQVPNVVTVTLQGSGADLMFCREQGCLRYADLMRFIEPCADAYDEQCEKADQSPHSRHDVSEWMPLVTA